MKGYFDGTYGFREAVSRVTFSGTIHKFDYRTKWERLNKIEHTHLRRDSKWVKNEKYPRNWSDKSIERRSKVWHLSVIAYWYI